MQHYIEILGAKEHNLKNIDVRIPKNKFVVVTGVSGSGKSSLVFDIINKEGQRQYLESLGQVTDFLSKPHVKSISGLSPAISVNQYLTNRNPRSTVGTVTEIYTYLRILFAKLGEQKCENCAERIKPVFLNDEEGAVDEYAGEGKLACQNCGKISSALTMAHFSFNKPEGMCPECTGLGTKQDVILQSIFDENLSIMEGAVYEWDAFLIQHNSEKIQKGAEYYGFDFHLNKPLKELSEEAKTYFLHGTLENAMQKYYPGKKAPKTNSQGRFEGLVTNLKRRFAERADDSAYRKKMSKYFEMQTCPACNGERLNEHSRNVTLKGYTLIEITQLQLNEVFDWLMEIYESTSGQELKILEPVFQDLKDRIRRLLDVGVGYLSMERGAITLSGGEAQRLRLASLLGSGLTGVLYVLDEPTIGLHPRDTLKMIDVLKQLRDLGNTVLVIEHDMDFVKHADYVLDIGPGAGREGGEVVAKGSPDEVAMAKNSKTSKYLNTFPNDSSHKTLIKKEFIHIKGAGEHNLKTIDVKIPINGLTAITGVSGSGKSTLIFDILQKVVSNKLNGLMEKSGKHETVEGIELFNNVITIDQLPIGRIPRSNAATYTDAWTDIRKLYSSSDLAKKKKLKPSHFSFNVEGGRCSKCNGAGVVTINMHFLPDVEVLCPSCKGKRFKDEILEVKYKKASVSDVLDMTVEEACVLFKEEAAIYRKINLLSEVGLGYLHLGQPATTLSGGEAQRIKLAKELSKQNANQNLYLLDEPTTGLHPYDTENLIKILSKLTSDGHTVVVVEHNTDLICQADWIVDLGPEGGDKGGELIYQGDLAGLKNRQDSFTARFI